MGDKFSVTIKNTSGKVQHYVVFAAEPTVRPTVACHTNVIFALRGVAGDGGQAYFTVPRDSLQALCGTNDTSNSIDKVQFEVVDTLPVQLGTMSDMNRVQPGSTCEMVVSEGVPRFAEAQTLPALGEEGGFCVKTRRDFTYKEAVAGRYVIGIAMSTKIVEEIGPLALFTPSPNEMYMIKPSRKFYVAAASLASRDPVTPDVKEKACAIDFDLLQTNHITLLHNEVGEIKQYVSPPLSKF